MKLCLTEVVHIRMLTDVFIYLLILVDMEDLKNFSKSQDAPEADDLNHWDISFWSERLRESKFDINEVLSLSVCVCVSVVLNL